MNGFVKIRRFTGHLVLAAAFCTAAAARDSSGDLPPPVWKKDPRFAEVALDAKTGEVLYGRHEKEIRHIASLTKVMTAYLVFEAMAAGKLKPEQALLVSRQAAQTYSNKIPLVAGQTMPLDDVMRALTALSSNGATVILAEAVAGSEAAFAHKMTEKARALGAKDTVWKTSSGLTAQGQYSTAYDIATVFAALRRDYPAAFSKYFSPEIISLRGQKYWNCYYCDRFNIVGHKGGFTNAAGRCFMALTDDGKNARVIVSLGAPDVPGRHLSAERVQEIAATLDKNP